MILNITLTVRKTLYNKATFVALIALLQLYFFSSNSVKNVTYGPVSFFFTLRHFCTVCTEKIRIFEYIFIALLQLYIYFFSPTSKCNL